MMRATLESAADGMLVTDDRHVVTGFNQKYVDMWRIPAEVLEWRDHRRLVELHAGQLDDPPAFLETIEEIYALSPPESHDVLRLADGRVFERFSRLQVVD